MSDTIAGKQPCAHPQCRYWTGRGIVCFLHQDWLAEVIASAEGGIPVATTTNTGGLG